ncbi:CCR4-NOT transcription complex subunit 1-like isoform X2 [Lytechinus pictus]|uniref:CCR4-NOT transcription complex subunit 1-like isoform X2 n=1 Tax=Lytechinus pictus TaxID=7653 RepID=UPI0030B9F577
MNLDSLSLAFSQITNLVANLNKKNYKQSVGEISRLVSHNGPEADRHLLRCLFSYIDFCDGKSSGKDFYETQLLIQECSLLITKPNFVSTLCFAIDNPLHQQKSLKPSQQFFTQLSKILKLTSVQEVVFGLALTHSVKSETRSLALQFVKQKLPDLVRAYIDADIRNQQESGLADFSVEILQLLLSHLLYRSPDQLGLGTVQLEAFTKTLKKEFPPERVPVVLAPLLYGDKQDIHMDRVISDSIAIPKGVMDGSLAELMQEMGYSCCATVEECHKTLVQFGINGLTAGNVAKVIGMMARTHTGLMDNLPLQSVSGASVWSDGKDKQDQSGQLSTWDVDTFIKVVRELAPHINFKEVVFELDHPGFYIGDSQSLRLVKTALIRGLQQEVFPVEALYTRVWKNFEGQLSWIQQALSQPDIFCFADYPCHPVVIDILKAPPEEENRKIATWKSLELVEVLLKLSETGKYEQVKNLFSFPIKHCPDMLLLALLQVQPTMTPLRLELIAVLMPIFLGNHPNSGIVLHYAWHGQGQSPTIRQIVMHSMADWYMRGDSDQTRLSRILDVAQDLKALSLLLNATPFLFVIDLACLASRREYLKLDKWMTDKIREHGESFVQTCVKFLKRRAPQVMGGMPPEPRELPGGGKTGVLPPETIGTMLACLQACVSSVSPELAETIMNMVANCGNLLKSRPPPGVMNNQGIPPISPGPGTPIDSLPGMPPLGSTMGTSMGSTMASNMGSTMASNMGSTMGSTLGSTMGSTMGSSAPSMTTPNLHPFSSNPLGSSFGQPPQSPQKTFPMLSGPGPNLGGLINPSQSTSHPSSEKSDISNIWPELNQSFSPEIDEEANSYFQQIYNQPPNPIMSVDDVLQMLKQFKDSQVTREREVFMCMLRNLFEEYKFFPQYPERELLITACLFGGVIEQGLVTFMALGMALRYVLEALRKSHNSKMYMFGIAALDKFKLRLKDFAQYCTHVASIPHFKQFPEHLIEYVTYGQQSMEPPVASRPQPTPTTTTATVTTTASSILSTTKPTTATTTVSAIKPIAKAAPKPSIANTTNIDTLLVATPKEEIKEPSEQVQDKIAFIFNNLSQVNLVQKCEEMKELCLEEHLEWISRYLVLKRASIETNFHTLYSNFVDQIKLAKLADLVLKETYRNIGVLLASSKSDSNFSDRTLLKNLGHWLGKLTLAKNKPILQVDLDMKALILEAYHKGQAELLYVVPFVAKVIESCTKSRIFKPPNPWTMAIMNVLAELHQEPNLKLNLKFEVEVLCKAFSITMDDLKPGMYLKDLEMVGLIPHKLTTSKKFMEGGAFGISVGMGQDNPPSSVGGLAVPLPTVPNSSLVGDQGIASAVPTPPTPSLPATPAPVPQFSFQDLNTSALTGIAPLTSVNAQLAIFQAHPQLRNCVRPAVERAVQELVHPVVDRSIKIALSTCEQIVKKDFALDPEENRMRLAAHHMVRNLTAGMAMITCHEPLIFSIINNFKLSCIAALKGGTPQQKELIEQAASVVANDNVELACCFIQKCAVEKAIPEMDRRLATEIELRKHARNENRRYCDPVVLTYQAERMPEQIRLKVGGVPQGQIAVYEEFARSIPGFLPTPEANQPPGFLAKLTQSYAVDEITQIYDKCITEIDQHLQFINQVMPQSQHVQILHALLESVMVARNSREIVTALACLQKAVEGLLEGYTVSSLDPNAALRYRDAHILVLKSLQDQRAYGPQWTNKQVTRVVCETNSERKYNLDAIEQLLRTHLVNLQTIDMHIATSMENGLNYGAVGFAMSVVKRFLIDEKQSNVLNEADLYNTLHVLARIATQSPNPPEGLPQLIELVRQNHDPAFLDKAPGGPTSMMHSGISQAREFDDPPGLREKTEYLLREWVNMYYSPAGGKDSTKAFSAFVNQMHQQGILKTDDLITRFFRLSIELCVDVCYRALAEQVHSQALTRAKCFQTLDAFVRLIALLVKHSGDATNPVTKINLLNKVLGIVAGVLLQDHEVRQTEFHQLAYHRIFSMLLLELNAPEQILEAINFQVMSAFCNALHVLRPSKAPGFVYAWLELISHRIFIARMLGMLPQQKGWPMYAGLLTGLFKFMTPFMRNAELPKHLALLYKGTLRVLLVLLHDFPEFLCDYHYGFCDVIPPNCIQMRNLILSAFPRNMRLPDPFTPNLKVDMLADIAHHPRILTNYVTVIQPASFKKDLDSYIKTRSPVTFLSELRSHIQVSQEPGQRYNVSLMNALVLYVGMQAINYIQSKGSTPSMSTITHSSHMDIYQNLVVDLDTEGRYLFLNAIANQLRYPNSHTHYFSCTLLYLFAEANTEAIQEQITRVLLERLIVNRPHPWGLLITFIELIRNHHFKFWSHEFVHCAPEIKKLFESVARSCMQQKGSAQPGIARDNAEVHET